MIGVTLSSAYTLAQKKGASLPSRRLSAKTSATSAITVRYRVSRRGLPAPSRVRDWAVAALDRPALASVIFVGAREGRALNRAWRGKDYATNVLSLEYGAVAPDAPIAGDVVLCVPVIRREARSQGKSLHAHVAHLIVHGVLHTQGYDHERGARESARMQAREVAILATLGFADPYEPRHGHL